jgi:hypothetical protein
MALALFVPKKTGCLTNFKKISKKWFTKYKVMDIITVVSKKFRRRSSKMMRTNNCAVPTTAAFAVFGLKTAYLNITHSTRLEWIA